MKWAAIRAAYHAGCLSALPDVTGVNIAGSEDIDWRSVGWSSNVSPVPVVYVGTPGVSRKAVIHLVNPASGICDAIVKVPLTEAAKAAILREADVLDMLADEDYTCSPRLLHVDRDRGITTQTALNGKAGGRKFAAAYWAALRSLMLADETTTIVGHAAEWQEQLLSAVGCESDMRTMTAALSELWDAHRLPACWVHGDFAPWNIRHLPDGTTAILDWEDAHRSGLPLQDAFHFLHIQDYLFGARPTVHSSDMLGFAKASGISPEQCHKLEIAYLAHTYLQRLAVGEVEHAEYLLATLRAVLQERHLLPAPTVDFTVMGSPELAPIAASSRAMRIRADLFAAVIAQLNCAEIPYCVLSGDENHAEKNASDVDFMFHPLDMNRIAPILAQAARGAGARLIQAMRHETSACYFVIAKDDGSEIGYLDPDSAGDYRRQGRLWLSAEKVLARRRRCREHYVPAVPDEFTYYLIKKVLKQSVADFQLRRLRHLFQRDAVNCRAEILKFWSVATVPAVERALVANDLAWFQSHLPGLLAELKASGQVEKLGRRFVQRLRDAARLAGRILHPTGMAILVCGGGRKQRSAIAQALVQQLSPAFRRTANVQLDPAGTIAMTSSFRLAINILVARLRS
ncbi:MAG TPA: aminoglycoside phosphotransferase family protein, partial [Terriglobales bacterium]|nr:aminoglycoside phosphotransferase family protein [Terriglobales bacterium]